MTISTSDWEKYISTLRVLNDAAANDIEKYIERNGIEDTKELIDYSYAIVNKYGEASAALSAEMYDAIAMLEGHYLEPAELAPIAEYGDVAKAINGTIKTTDNAEEISSAAARWVKMASADTTLHNAMRDGAEFAWIPHGDTCAFCIMLASNGWQKMSKKALKGGHAEHIHSNCDCTFAIRFSKNDNVEGYDPDEYKRIYKNAPGRTYEEKLNSIRREQYAIGKAEENKPWDSAKMSAVLGKDYSEFKDLVNNSANRAIYDLFSEGANYKYESDGGVYRRGSQTVVYSMRDKEGMSRYSTLAHEEGHFFDDKIGRGANLTYTEVDLINDRTRFGSGTFLTLQPVASNCDEFLTALRADMEALKPKVKDRSIRTEFLTTTVKKNATSGIQDALDGFFDTMDDGVLPWGHGGRYYNRGFNNRIKPFGQAKNLQAAYNELGLDASNQAKAKRLFRTYEAASEAWANVSCAVTVGGEELEAIRMYMPNTYQAYLHIIEGIE